MSEPNPYEPPRESEQLTTGKVVKRGIGVGVILLLTPLAVLIAFGASCAAVNVFMDRFVEKPLFGNAFVVVAFSIFLLPPAITLVGMIWWASATYRRSVLPARKKSPR
jgi:hypothetical protein